MELSRKTSENLVFNIEKDTPKDSIADSILNCIRKCADKIENIMNRETIEVSRNEKTLTETIEYNVKLNTGKEISLKEIDPEDKYELRLSGTQRTYEEKIKDALNNSRDLIEKKIDLKNEDERRQLVLNSTPLQLNELLRESRDVYHPIKEELKSLIDESKYNSEYGDRADAREVTEYAIRTMEASELQQLLDGKDVFCLGSYDKICMFPASPIYETRAKEIFTNTDSALDVKFAIKSPDIYDHLSVSRYTVDAYDSGDEYFKSSLVSEPCLDIVIEGKDEDIKVLSPEYQLDSYNIGDLVPVEINGKDVSGMTISQIADYVKEITSIDIDKGVLGTGKVLEDIALKDYIVRDEDILSKEDYAKIRGQVEIRSEEDKKDVAEKIEKLSKDSKDLLDIKDKTDRQNFVLNSTLREISQRINPDKREINCKEKDELISKFDISKYSKEDQDRIQEKINRGLNPIETCCRTMSASQFYQMLDCKTTNNVNGTDQVTYFFPNTPVLEDRSKGLFSQDNFFDYGLKENIHVVFEIANPSVYSQLTQAEYGVSDYSMRPDPIFDETLKGSDVRTSEYQVPFNDCHLGNLIPVEIDGIDVRDKTTKEIIEMLEKENIHSIYEVDPQKIGTGNVVETLEKNQLLIKDYEKRLIEDAKQDIIERQKEEHERALDKRLFNERCDKLVRSNDENIRNLIEKNRDLYVMEDRLERANLIRSSTPEQISRLINPDERDVNSDIQRDLESKFDIEKYDENDKFTYEEHSFYGEDLSRCVCGVLSSAEMMQLLDGKELHNIDGGDIKLLPYSPAYFNQIHEILEKEEGSAIVFRVRDSSIYDSLKEEKDKVSTSDNYELDKYMDKCFDRVVSEEKGVAEIMRPTFSLESIDIGKLVPVFDNMMPINDYPIDTFIGGYDTDERYSIPYEYVGTGLTTEAMQKTEY